MNKIPTYKISIKDISSTKSEEMLGIEEIAMVSDPAILIKGIAFNQQFRSLSIHPNCQCQIIDNKWKFGENPCEICLEAEKLWKEGKASFESHLEKHNNIELRFADELKLRVAAPIMIPMEIYRFSNDIGEYNIQFDEETIYQIVNKMMSEGKTNMFNLDHNTGERINSRLIECWFVEDPATDKSKTIYGIDGLPKGTYFGVVQFDNKEFFKNEIIDKGRTGISIEGMFNLEFKNLIKQEKNKKEEMENTIETLQKELEIALAKINELELAKKPIDPTSTNCDMATASTSDMNPAEQTEPSNVAENTIDEAAILAIVGPKFDEIYKKLADLQSQLDADMAEEDTTTAVNMNKVNEEFNVFSFMRELKTRK